MISKENRCCVYCNKTYRMSAAIKGRLKKFGQTEVKCLGCGKYFDLFDEPEDIVTNNIK